MKPYFEDDAVTIYHGDCREVLPTLGTVDLVLTDPPYPNQSGHFDSAVIAAGWLLGEPIAVEQMMFWSEVNPPKMSVPLVAVHIWHRTNVNGKIYEPIYHYHRDARKRRSDLIGGPAIFNGAGPGCAEYLGHPTQKPIHVMRWLLGKTDAQTTLDPFMGSGTTLRAAKDLGRKAIGIEIEERYCEIAARRMSQAVLL